ncbi:TOTE conflict system archaeo-eukaryotic primase domain-containing protein [Paenibacillus donghaensis]|uniref:Restriction endonuclease subunit R n=1 Tax=Paenibacillus donghaensis TaxID=414771 RepID=A0A2Z2KLG4_9BACL|nr:DEAD/DEAH box helicase [Paenibacillus donghaensis]ASA25145.1 restriction endonuclease subunit R [Paenibacillus donghaensis]
MDNMEDKYNAALAHIEELKQEITRLRHLLGLPDEDNTTSTNEQMTVYSTSPVKINNEPTIGESNVHQYSTVEDKLALYKSCFRGRDDVYPIRWSNKQGKTGYSPACANEWTAFCEKPRVKCSVCKHQSFMPLTNEVLSAHLDARQDRTIGIYPMLPDETCWFLAMDFDKHDWKKDVAAVMQLCKSHHIPALLERSRSGNGGHIWIFFSQNIAAATARRLGMALLSLSMNKRYQIGMESYDRLFPNQDTLPKGGFGNLIALPLQGGPRKLGNSVFIDEHFEPYADPWSILSGLGKLNEDEVKQFIYKHGERGLFNNDSITAVSDHEADELTLLQKNPTQLEEVLMEALPAELQVLHSDRLYIPKSGLPSSAIHALIRIASFSNPDFYKTQAMRLSTYGKPRVISCAEDLESYVVLPRGCLPELLSFFEHNHVKVSLVDQRSIGTTIAAEFTGTLTTLQDTAARAILNRDIGVLSAATAFGKTVVAASIIASRKTNTLILVHRRELMEQWQERLQTFLEVPKHSIGVIGGGKNKRTGIIDIAVIQSLNYKGNVKPFVSEYGQVIVDECHHVSAYSFEQVLREVQAKYVFGLTATPKRQDGQEAIVRFQLGPVLMKIDGRTLSSSRGFSLRVIPRYTLFQIKPGEQVTGIQDIYQQLVDNEERNTLIFDDLLTCLDEGRSPLLLVERTAHAEYFAERLQPFAKNVIVLRGRMGKKQREALRAQIASIPDDQERVVIATGKLIGEGFDDARLDTLFLVHPISWSGTLQQYAGRLHRSHVNKEEVKIYDYIDLQVPMLMAMFKKRVKGYRKMGYKGAEL